MPLNSKYFKSPDLHITFSGTPSWFPELVRGPHTSPRALFISFPQDLLLNSRIVTYSLVLPAVWHSVSSWGARPLPTSLQYHLRTQLSVRQENHERSQQPSINIHSLPSVDHRQHDWIILWIWSVKMFLESSKNQGCGASRHCTLIARSYNVSPFVSMQNILDGRKYVPHWFSFQGDSNSNQGVGEMAQQAKCLLSMYKDLSLDP